MTSQTPQAFLKAVAPVLPVRQMVKAIEWYTHQLGFEAVFANGEPPVYAILRRDEVAIHLQLEEAHHAAGTGNCYCEVGEVEALHTEYQARDVRFVSKLGIQGYGMKDFVIADLDGNWIGFGAPAHEQVK